MPTPAPDPTDGLARRLRLEREARGWSLADLAARSGVSKAMISKVERAEASPTAALLGRLSGAFGLTLSTLLARAEGETGQLRRHAAQPVWIDPATGYRRRQVSPHLSPAADNPLDLTEVELPAGAAISYPAASYAFMRQTIWMLDGTLTFQEGEATHVLEAGDCLALGAPADCTFANRGERPCRYLVAVVRQR
ncbi:LacI family transcriptional regulator [Methylobacterium variabile]|jgi:transcriptional regulator with XRE-family HTH domain|uniref:LacI family transcriptional regulator n=1 Tax=Methylobacterium variabile TaxID=298794 RepID=A0A0J6S702_9HYPH|nr:XRE family transcriptional regulator [Methylobacterium variabile]KMO29417.1 LacI family transcriptional regulator [Methylobacterium variabile]